MLSIFIPLFLLINSIFATVPDPYRWLEEESKEQKEWVAQQAARTEHYLSQHPERKEIEKRLSAIADYETIGLPEQNGKAFYYSKHRKGEDKSVLIEQLDGKESVLFDPNQSGEEVVLIDFSISPTGRHLAYGLSLTGSDQHVWRILDLKTKEPLPEVLDQIQFSKVNWDNEGKSVFYVRNCQQLFRHTLGTDISDDELLYEGPEGHMLYDPEPVLGGRSILLRERPWWEEYHRTMLVELAGICTPPYAAYELIPAGDVEFSYIGEGNGQLLFISDEECCFGKLLAIDFQRKKIVIPEQKSVLQDAAVVGNRLVCLYYNHAVAELKIFDLEGNYLEDIPLPGKGSVFFEHVKNAPYFYYAYTDFKTPRQIFAYNFEEHSNISFFPLELNFDPDLFATSQVWYTSKDGTLIPLFLTHRKDLEINEKTPVLLYGYGGFGISVTPFFRPEFLGWLESGGVLALPSLRGGKEFGNVWHEQGRKFNKQNVFDDFIAAAEYLSQNQIGSRQTLAIYGTSNGGLLTGACLTQAPNLFRAAIVNKGVLDMLRFHLYTIGKFWISEYGNPDDLKESEYLLSYSPYHQVKNGTDYPAVLVNTADHDDRVVPLHSFKFAAALLGANGGSRPILLRIEKACGHGGSNSHSQEISFGTDMLTFLNSELK